MLKRFYTAIVHRRRAVLAAFVDFGNVYNGTDNFDAGELRASAGVALLWRAPAFRVPPPSARPLSPKGAFLQNGPAAARTPRGLLAAAA